MQELFKKWITGIYKTDDYEHALDKCDHDSLISADILIAFKTGYEAAMKEHYTLLEVLEGMNHPVIPNPLGYRESVISALRGKRKIELDKYLVEGVEEYRKKKEDARQRGLSWRITR